MARNTTKSRVRGVKHEISKTPQTSRNSRQAQSPLAALQPSQQLKIPCPLGRLPIRRRHLGTGTKDQAGGVPVESIREWKNEKRPGKKLKKQSRFENITLISYYHFSKAWTNSTMLNESG
ncbi:hypothetical protein BGX38DRAFT_1147497 [Terfezia claveryi]|nr:hypothetical protein BGX38DRAFT_1147497 [Terfezia claveryi]